MQKIGAKMALFGFLMGQEDYRELSFFLNRFLRRLKLLKGAEGLCMTAICALLLFALGPGVQLIKQAFPYAPVIYSGLTSVLLLFLIAWTAFQCVRRFSREWAARYIEQKQPHLRNNLINSLQLYPQVADEKDAQGVSASMILALLRATRRQLQGLRIEDLISAGRLKADLRLLGILFVPVLAMVLFNPSSVGETFSLLTQPLKDLPPSQTSIDVTPKGLRVLRGSSVTFQAAASGAIPKSMDLVISPVSVNRSERSSQEERLVMENLGSGNFTATLPKVHKSIQYRVVTGPFFSSTYTIEAVDPPEIGNVNVTLYPPHYTGLPAQSFPGGNVEGIKGSTIRLEAQTTKEVIKARLLTEDGREVPLKIDGKKLQGNLVLFQSQRYQLVVEDSLGFRNSPVSYEMRIRPDGFPTVDLLRPGEDLEVNGDEVLPLEFSARDDFGIQEVRLAISIGNRQEKIPVETQGTKKWILRERYNWDIGKLGLQEGDEAVFHLEVLDNDNISGPKLGISRALRLRLKNLKAEHKQVAEMIRDLSARMLDTLADHLETPLSGEKELPRSGEPPADKFDQNLAELMKRIEEVMQRTEKDRLSDFATWSDLEALKRNLKYTKEELLAKRDQAASQEEKSKFNDEISSELERMSLLSEEIGKRLKAQEVASAAQDLLKSQERLLESLEKLQSGDKNLDAIMKEISQLANLLSSLQQALSQMATSLPDEFVNNEAMRGLGFNEMLSALEEIRKKLMEGDIEGARQLARELFNQLASMVASLQNAQRSAMSSSLGRMQGEMMRGTNELQQILREQQEILVETEGVNKKSLEEKEALLKEQLDRFQAKAKEELSRLAELFPDEERESNQESGPPGEQLDDATMNHLIKNLISRMLEKDFPGFAEGLGLARKELAKNRAPAQEPKSRQAETSLAGLEKELESLLNLPFPELKDPEKRGLRDLSSRQGILRERTQELHEKLKSLFQLFPSLDPKITKNIEEAGTSMGKARDRLGGLDGRGAVPPEREALELLSQSQEQMQNAMQQLAQRGQLGRMPVTYLFRRGRFLPSGMLVPLPGMPEFPQFDVEGGFTGMDTEKFRLPGKEDYKVPRSFREEILESLKQGVPPQLKEQIESYFKNLSE